MKKLLNVLLLVGLAALGYWGWTVLHPSPQQAVRNRLNKLAKLASFSASEGNIMRVAKVQKLGLLFAEDVQVTIDGPGGDARTLNFTRREELMQAAMAAKRFANGLKAEFLDLNVKMGPGDESATADLILKAKVSGENDMIAQELMFTLNHTNGDWLITRIDTVKSLKP